jgi:hypothetical protein
MATEAPAELNATRESAMRVAQLLLTKGQKGEAIEILTAWASASNDQEGHKLLAEALRHGPDSPLAKAAFARMEGLSADHSALDQARVKWSREALDRLEKESKKAPVGGWQAEVGYNNNVKYRDQVFHIQTEDSGTKRPHIITHLFADGGRILKSIKRSYAALIGTSDLPNQVRTWMKNQHKEMYIALREGRFDNIIDGKETGGMEVLEGAPNPERRGRDKPASSESGEQQAAVDSRAKPPSSDDRPKPPTSDVRPATTPGSARPQPSSSSSSSSLAAPSPPAGASAPATPPAATPAAARAPSTALPPRPATSPSRPAVAPPVAQAARARLHVIRALGDGPILHELRDDVTHIGRKGAVAVVGDKFVADKHAKLAFRNGKLELEDLGTENGTFLRVRYPVELEFGDIFIAGDQVLRVEANPPPNDGPDAYPTYFYSSPKWPTTFRVVQLWEGGALGQCVVARTNSLQVGRSTSDLCFAHDFWLDDAHCLIEDQGGFLMLTDLGTRGGTFVKTKGPMRVATGDELMVGRTRLRVELLASGKPGS